MRFTAASVALFAGIAVALPNGDLETVYSTEDVTITSCAPTVTDCPSRQTSTPQAVEAITSSVPAVASSAPASSSSPVAPVEAPSSSPVAPVEAPSSSPAPAPSSPAAGPSSPVVPVQVPTSSASVIPVTTCIPTVTYSTIQVPVTPSGPAGQRPSGAAAKGTSSVPVIPAPSGQGAAGGNPR